MRKFVSVVFVILASLAGRTAHGVPVTPPNVPAMTAASDLIVVGRVTGTPRWEGSPGQGRETFQLAVDRVLKGPNTSRARPIVVSLEPVGGAGHVNTGDYGFFFLRAGAEGRYSAADPGNPALVASPSYSSNSGASVLDPVARVTEELAKVLATSTAVVADSRSGLQQGLPEVMERPAGNPGIYGTVTSYHQVVVGPADTAQDIYLRAYKALKSVPLDVAREPLNAVVKSNGELLGQLWAIACLAELGDLNNLAQVKTFLLNPADSLEMTTEVLALSMKHNVVSDTTVPLLSELLRSKSVEIRRAAAYSLRQVGELAAAEPLTLALHDSDKEVRFYAVSGLCKITQICRAPMIDYFKNETVQRD